MNRCENCKCWKDRRFLLVQVTKNVHQPISMFTSSSYSRETTPINLPPSPKYRKDFLVRMTGECLHWDLEHVHVLVVEYSPFYLQPGFVPGSITALVSLLYLFFYAWVFFLKQKLRLIVHMVLINGSPDGALMILMVVTNSLPLPL